MITKHQIGYPSGRTPEVLEYELFHRPPWGGWNKVGNYQSRAAALHAARTVVQTDAIGPDPDGTPFRVVGPDGIPEEFILIR